MAVGASSAVADPTGPQAASAARIAELALVDEAVPQGDGPAFQLYRGLFRYRRTLELDGCILRYTATPKVRADAQPSHVAEFDLTFTFLETDPENATHHFVYHEGTGAISLRTDPAHPGTIHSRVLDATTPETYIESTVSGPVETRATDRLAYFIDGLSGAGRVQALADALMSYRVEYCVPSS
ncbi:hypothetical protein [Oceaniglobus indicus]|uniref:hypothetical protein n=1 Tax=Oceaniglobus indicus TaxID=2047749 RepID=UPI00130430DA|nr:hypothetical protein [Oceaniglobus indicus]